MQLKEPSIRDAMALASMPEHLGEAAISAFLSSAVESVTKGPDDPRLWTVQERLLMIGHYLASVSEGGPDFGVGERGHFSDYMDAAKELKDISDQVDAGEIAGDRWQVGHLLGGWAESIERLEGEIEGIKGRLHWTIGGIAAQMRRDRDSWLDEAATDGEIDEFLLKRMAIIAAFPESDFADMTRGYLKGVDQIAHLFTIRFSDQGVVALPREAGGALPPARFPARACLSRMALEMAG